MGSGRARAEHARAALRSAFYLQAAMEHPGTVMHAPKSHAVNTAILGREARTVVAYLQEERIPVTPVVQIDILRRTMR